MDRTAEELLAFWLDEVGPDGWFRQDEAFDASIRDRWGELWERARGGGLVEWRAAPRSALALVILLDQFPRNMFRGDARAFSSDGRAVAVAKTEILHGHDRRVELPARHFFYMPLMHSEIQTNQDRCVRLFLINYGREGYLRHAVAHREIIRRFGRFPFRNAALGRESTPAEIAFLEAGGYLTVFKATAFKASAA
jgi:uncharacterized protein (DUF924 family)